MKNCLCKSALVAAAISSASLTSIPSHAVVITALGTVINLETVSKDELVNGNFAAINTNTGSTIRFGTILQNDSASVLVNKFDPAFGQLNAVHLLSESVKFTTSAFTRWSDASCDGTSVLGVCSSSDVGGSISLVNLGFTVSVDSTVLGSSPTIANRTDSCSDTISFSTGIPLCQTNLAKEQTPVSDLDIVLTGTDVNDFIAGAPGEQFLAEFLQTGEFDYLSAHPFSDTGEAVHEGSCPEDSTGFLCSSFEVSANFFVLYDYTPAPPPPTDPPPNSGAVPEPGMLVLFGLGLVGLAFARRRRAA